MNEGGGCATRFNTTHGIIFLTIPGKKDNDNDYAEQKK